MTTTNATTSLTWKCSCGNVQIPIQGLPLIDVTCHCRSCVSVIQFIEQKADNGKPPRISGLDKQNGGATYSGIPLNHFELSPHDAPKFGYVKLGKNGPKARVYTQCCHTFVFHGGSWPFCFRMFNRHGLILANGSPYTPSIIYNIMKNHAADPTKVPLDNTSDERPPSLTRLLEASRTPDRDLTPYLNHPIVNPDLDTCQVVPMTWDEEP